MFSIRQKQEIAEAVQQILRKTNHPELPKEGEIQFELRVQGAEDWSYAYIRNNGAVTDREPNPWNEMMDDKGRGRVAPEAGPNVFNDGRINMDKESPEHLENMRIIGMIGNALRDAKNNGQ